MKTILTALILLCSIHAGFAQNGKADSSKHHMQAKHAKKYTCSMHPEVVRSKPGKCPKCGMKLIPMRKKAHS